MQYQTFPLVEIQIISNAIVFDLWLFFQDHLIFLNHVHDNFFCVYVHKASAKTFTKFHTIRMTKNKK